MRHFLLLFAVLPAMAWATDDESCGAKFSGAAVDAAAREVLAAVGRQPTLMVGQTIRIEKTSASPPLSRPESGVLVRVKHRRDLDLVRNLVAGVAKGVPFPVEVVLDPKVGPIHAGPAR